MRCCLADYPLGGVRDFLIKKTLVWFFILVQDLTDDSKTVGDSGKSEDGHDKNTSLSDPTDEQPMGEVEAVEGKQEVRSSQPPRRASTSTPSNLPVRLLTRLGSLDGEFTKRALMYAISVVCSPASR